MDKKNIKLTFVYQDKKVAEKTVPFATPVYGKKYLCGKD